MCIIRLCQLIKFRLAGHWSFYGAGNKVSGQAGATCHNFLRPNRWEQLLYFGDLDVAGFKKSPISYVVGFALMITVSACILDEWLYNELILNGLMTAEERQQRTV